MFSILWSQDLSYYANTQCILSVRSSPLGYYLFFISWLPLTHQFSSFQLLICVWLFATLWTAARQASLSITNSESLFRLMSIESVMPSNHLPLLSSPSPPTFNLSQHQGLFQWVSSSHQVAKILEFQHISWLVLQTLWDLCLNKRWGWGGKPYYLLKPEHKYALINDFYDVSKTIRIDWIDIALLTSQKSLISAYLCSISN